MWRALGDERNASGAGDRLPGEDRVREVTFRMLIARRVLALTLGLFDLLPAWAQNPCEGRGGALSAFEAR